MKLPCDTSLESQRNPYGIKPIGQLLVGIIRQMYQNFPSIKWIEYELRFIHFLSFEQHTIPLQMYVANVKSDQGT